MTCYIIDAFADQPFRGNPAALYAVSELMV